MKGNMDLIRLKHPQTLLTVSKYYWPDSLDGQANHTRPSGKNYHVSVTRADGTKTCSCGLIFTGNDLERFGNPAILPLDEFGHRNHVTGEPEPIYETPFRDFEGTGATIRVCEMCGWTSTSHPQFFNSNGTHDCEVAQLPESWQIWATVRALIRNKSFGFIPGYNAAYSKDLGSLCLVLGMEGAFLSSYDSDSIFPFTSAPNFRRTLRDLLQVAPLVMSEEIHPEVDHIETSWMYEYKNPTMPDLEPFWGAELPPELGTYIVFNGDHWGKFDFTSKPVEVDSCVRYIMTTDMFTINAPRTNIPVIQMPVIGLV